MHFQGLVAANLPGHQYSIRESLRSFFAKTTVERPECDEKAIQLVGGTTVMPVTIQGNYSYTLYAGPSLEFIVQFRHLHLPIDVQTMALAREIHGELVPPILETGEIGTLRNAHLLTTTSSEIPTRITPLAWHVFPRVQARCASGMAISYLDFLKTHRTPDLSPGTTTHQHLQRCRKTLINGVARFFATQWNHPQPISPDATIKHRAAATRDLHLLTSALDTRFHPVIQQCLDSMDDVFQLPTVFLHRDFSTANIMVHPETCELLGVIDWRGAGVGLFGQDLHFVQNLTCTLGKDGMWRALDDFGILQQEFWNTFLRDADHNCGNRYLSGRGVETIKTASRMSLLLYRGFTRRVPGVPALPKGDDEAGRSSKRFLEAFLLDEVTKIR